MISSDLSPFPKLLFAAPDALLPIALFVLFVSRSFLSEEKAKTIFPKFSLTMSFICLIVTLSHSTTWNNSSNSLFIYNASLSYIKSILMGCSIVAFAIMSITSIWKMLPSYIYIFLFGIINSIVLCLSANHFLLLLLGLELYTFSICFLLMNSEKDDELQKGVARFLLASYSATAILLFGMSLYFSGSGSLSFPSINFDADLTTTVATTLVISALLFKMGVAPFHSWMIDIYERSSFGLIVFFDAIWKFFIFFIFTRFFKIILDAEYFQIQIFIEVVSSLSMMIGAIMPIFQKNIKKFVAYASIGHAGFVMSVFATVRDVSSLSNAALYIISYSFASICFFTIILKLSKYRPIVTFEDLCGLMKDSPRLGYCMLASMFAMTGIPPFINFTAKLQIFTMQLSNEHHVLLAISLVFSILSVLYTGKVMINIFKPRSNSLKTPKSGIEVFLSFFAIVIAPFFYLLTDEWIKGLLRHI